MPIVFIIIGILLIVFHKPIARSTMLQREQQLNRTFSEEQKKIADFFPILTGIAFIIFAILDLLGITIRKS